ncbi:hypothetical protein RJT34_11361 [Clitoria ternatea]|uniref:SANTA domain-containing protein n=1 Tax=Clitoria ternatea TaxID=43366 RepID=A0AAN9PID8_CLITE
MAATSTSNTKPIPPSIIFLHEWWLVKQPKGLAVHGLASMKRARLFTSAVIAKRHEANVLETEDGITVMFRGFINTSKSCINGVPSEVCRRFMFGFPFDWKKYSTHSFGDEDIDGVTGFSGTSASSKKRADDALPFSIRGNDFMKRWEYLLSKNCSAPKNICNEMGSFSGNVIQSDSTANMEHSMAMEKDKTANIHSSQPHQVNMMCGGENEVSEFAVESQVGNPKSGQSLMGIVDPDSCTHLSREGTVKTSTSTKEKQDIQQKIVEDTSNSCNKMLRGSISIRKDRQLKQNAVPVRRSPRLNRCNNNVL